MLHSKEGKLIVGCGRGWGRHYGVIQKVELAHEKGKKLILSGGRTYRGISLEERGDSFEWLTR